ncbi:MAG: peptidylprolyl isomerase [Clostridiales bacterium]|nr:peptidylprolyl isomerase [Clostridiales bacterium]
MNRFGKYSLMAVSILMAGQALLTGCGDTTPDNDPNLVAMVGKARLMRSDLDKALAGTPTGADSTRLARAYVKSWIDSHIMTEVAQRNIPDMSEIDRMVEQYRSELIAWEYRRLMFLHNADREFPDDSIRSYYDSHSREFVLERPVVKGVYVKIADNSPSLARVRKLYRSTRDADIDRLEKQDLEGLIHYDYFRDRWVDWDQIETLIPIDFGTSPDQFLATHDHVEASANGYTHMLEISEYLKAGSVMPLERARELIVRDLFNLKRREYDRRLRLDLYNQGLSDGTIKVNVQLD